MHSTTNFTAPNMVPDLQKPRVTEIRVRMDCNGCVQKVKKALNGINGLYDFYIDFPQQKITIIGWADPEKIVKAIKKTRKMATICNIEQQHDESQSHQPQPAEESSLLSQPNGKDEPDPLPRENNAQVHEATTQPPQTEAPPAQAGPTEEPSKETPQHEQPQPEATPAPTENNNTSNTSGIKDVGEVHVIQQQHHPPNYGNRIGSGQGYIGHNNNTNRYQNGPTFLHEPPQPVYVTQSYNTYRPSPYVTEYEYVRSSPPRQQHYTYNNLVEHYYSSGDYHHHNGNGNITSIFSDENPNACTIV